MADTRVRLRSDLETRSETADSNSPVILKDPLTGRFYRFSAVQGAVLRRLDGTRDFRSVAESVARECLTSVTEPQVEDFAVKLRNLLLLDDEACWVRLRALGKPRRSVIRSLLSIKIHAFDPEQLLGRLERGLSLCFSPWFPAIVWATVAAGVVISVLNWDSLFLSFGSLFSLYSVPLIVAVIFVVMTLHEFAHAVTLRHFGGRTREMGFLLLYFIPAFYCNVSDAWMLKKRERLLVTLAGGYIQLFVWALATVCWRIAAPETFASRVCLITIAFSGIQALFNFNPLIRLDGYYLLSDLLGIPNLRQKSFKYLKRRVACWLGFSCAPGTEMRRERLIYGTYGSLSFLFSAGLIWLMIDRVGGWLVREYQLWGVILMSGIVLMAVPISGKEAAPIAQAAKPKRRIGFVTRLLVLAGVAAIIGVFPWELKVSGDFVINADKRVSVSAKIAGTLKAIHVDEGSRVRAGDILAELQNLDLSNKYEDMRGELEVKKASLALLLAGTRPEEIEKARRLVETKHAETKIALRVEQERNVLQETVARKKAELTQARTEYERNLKLHDEGLIARNELDQHRTDYEVAEKELSEAQGQLRVLEERTDRVWQVKTKELAEAESALKLLEAGSRKEAIQAMQAEVAKLEVNSGIIAQQLEYLKIRTEIDGVVATRYLRNRIGEFLETGDSLCEIVSLGVVRIDMPVPEKEIADVQAGFPITLKVRGYPHRSFEARVKAISPIAVESGLERKLVVQGELDNRDGILKAGMSGVGKIRCGERLIAELATRRLIRWLRTEFWEYIP
jgi:multidrug efflux pump subunit AcrA (membrane-fusion protein)